MKLPKAYNPKQSEPRWLEFWEKEKIYAFEPESKAEAYSIDTPPPTVSGNMHLGHSFSYAQQDFVARFQRMLGKNVFYPFGVDDNGLATERMIEKMKNVRGQLMPRQEFVRLCYTTVEELRNDFVYDWKRLGISADFNIFYSTINRHSQRISQRSFIELYRMGRIYRKKAPFMWCPECRTAIAQVELKDAERDSCLVYIQAKVDGTNEEVIFATTRPELIYGSVGISVHPDDERYRHLIGKKVRIPLINRAIELTSDEYTDMEYGSGVVYYCTYGSVDCIEWLARHPGVEPIEIMGRDGRYNELSGRYKGMTSEEARKQVIEDLKKEGAIAKLEKIRHIVNTHERCDTDIEYIATEQWFIRYLDLKENFIDYGRRIKWHPEHMRARYENWIKGLKWDWNISRQRHFGIPIPVWYCKRCGEVIIADERQLPVEPLVDKPPTKCKCSSDYSSDDFIGEKDVLDTWATSSLTPDIAIEMLKGNNVYDDTHKKLFPMSLRPQAHDIITFWLFNTVVKSYFHHKSIPWENVMISGWALDPHGRKMSKSKGNVINPIEMIAKHSADSLRFWAAGSRLGDDLPFQEKDLATGDRFTTKLWNASKFTFMHLADYKKGDKEKKPAKLEPMEKWVFSKLARVLKSSTESFMKYEYSHAKLEAETFFWHTFCDNYIEIIKDRLYNPEKRGIEARLSAQYGLYHSLLAIIKLIAPIMPFITEEVYQAYYRQHEKSKSIHLAKWQDADIDDKMIDEHAEHIGDFAVKVIEYARKQKAEKKMSLKTPIKKLIIKAKIEEADFDAVEADINAATNAELIVYEPTKGKHTESEMEIKVEF